LPVWLHWVLIVVLPIAGALALFGIKGRTIEVLATLAGLIVLSAITVLWSTRYRDRNNVAMRVQQGA
jgi:hypothetical protein